MAKSAGDAPSIRFTDFNQEIHTLKLHLESTDQLGRVNYLLSGLGLSSMHTYDNTKRIHLNVWRSASQESCYPGTFVHDSAQYGHITNCWWRTHASFPQFVLTLLSSFVFQTIAHGYVSFGVFFIKCVDHQTLSRDKAVYAQPKQDQRKRKPTLTDHETAKAMNSVILSVCLADLPNKAWPWNCLMHHHDKKLSANHQTVILTVKLFAATPLHSFCVNCGWQTCGTMGKWGNGSMCRTFF